MTLWSCEVFFPLNPVIYPGHVDGDQESELLVKTVIKLASVFHHLPSASPIQLCALLLQVITHLVGT